MKLVVVRHGRDGAGGRLNEIGRDQVRRLALSVRKAGLIPTLLLSSQLPRALQSAEALSAEFAKVSGQSPLTVVELESLHQDAAVSGFVEEFPGIAKGHELVMAVSHMPIVYGIAKACGYQYPDTVQNASGIVVDIDPKAPCALTFVQTIAPEVP